MEDRERVIRETLDGLYVIRYEDISYLLALIDSLRASQEELVEAGEAILSAGYIFNTLKQAIEKIKEDK